MHHNGKEAKTMGIDFSDWLTRMLAEKNITQAELARKSGLSRQAISYYLSVKSKQPDEFALQKLAKALDLPIEEVYRAAGVPVSSSKRSKDIEEIIHQLEGMSKEDQERVLVLIQALKKFRRK